MFKYLALLLCLLAVAHAEHERQPEEYERKFIPILKSELNKNDDGSYAVLYEGGDGSARQEEATLVDAGTDDEALEVKGSYKYISDSGDEVEVFYTAGRNGFVPYGSIINPEISAAAEKAKFLPHEYEDEKKEYTKKKAAAS